MTARTDAAASTRPASAVRLLYRVCRLLCRLIFVLLYSGRVFGRRNLDLPGGAILVSNHQSFLDPMLVAMPLEPECDFMARDTLFRNGRFATLIRTFNAFPIKRGEIDVAGVKETLRRLKRGRIVVMFPEATRTQNGAIAPMQPGPIVLARRARVPIVPALVSGAYEAWPRQSFLPRLHPLVVAYGEPLRPEQLADLTDEAAIGIVRDRILALAAKHGSPLCRPAGEV